MLSLNKAIIAAYYYPAYPNKGGERWRTRNGSKDEWQLIRHAQPLFPGHEIKRPISYAGVPAYYDSSRPEIIENQARLARHYGVDVFIFDWYMDNQGLVLLEKPINNFIHSFKNELKFAINWSYLLPKGELPHKYPKDENSDLRKINITPEYFARLIDYCCDRYFYQDNYFKINNHPAVYLYNLASILALHEGRPKIFNACLEKGQQIAKSKGFGGVSFVGVLPNFDESLLGQISQYNVESFTGYAFLPNFRSTQRIQEYGRLIPQRLAEWEVLGKRLPSGWMPTVVSGWDASSRGSAGLPANYFTAKKGNEFPWSPVVVRATPGVFRKWLDMAQLFLKKHPRTPQIINICSWNEWTEGYAIEPNNLDSYGFLEAIKDFKATANH